MIGTLTRAITAIPGLRHPIAPQQPVAVRATTAAGAVWWHFEAYPLAFEARDVPVHDFHRSDNGHGLEPSHGTIRIEVDTEEARTWAHQLGRTWVVRGDGSERVMRLNGPIATFRAPGPGPGFPEFQTWRWEAISTRQRR